MSGPKQTLGYPSRTAAVLALRAQGLRPAAVARKLGIPHKTVAALECSARRSKRRARPAEENGRTVVFSTDVLDSLAVHAARRGIHVNALARRIVATVVDENIVDAVLDDGMEAAG